MLWDRGVRGKHSMEMPPSAMLFATRKSVGTKGGKEIGSSVRGEISSGWLMALLKRADDV